MLSFRDRFFTPTVATAMLSPLAIIVAGLGGAVGILAGGAAGAIGAIVGGMLGAVTAWATRVLLAVPRGPQQARIDPFTLAEPWRRLTQDALAARKQFDDAVRRTQPGPIRDRLATIGERINATIDEAWAAARAGHDLTDAYTRVDVASAQRELDALHATRSATGFNATTQATVTALEAQVATATRMYALITETRDQLQLLNARLDESVARCIELSVGTYRPDAFSEVEGDVGSITDELEALRGAIEDTSAVTAAPSMPAMPAESTATSTEPGGSGISRPQGQ